jgi:hypothetical protein
MQMTIPTKYIKNVPCNSFKDNIACWLFCLRRDFDSKMSSLMKIKTSLLLELGQTLGCYLLVSYCSIARLKNKNGRCLPASENNCANGFRLIRLDCFLSFLFHFIQILLHTHYLIVILYNWILERDAYISPPIHIALWIIHQFFSVLMKKLYSTFQYLQNNYNSCSRYMIMNDVNAYFVQ